MMKVAILTASDRSSKGERPDLSGPALINKVTELGWEVIHTKIVPDDLEIIQNTLIEWADNDQVDLILTTGGTGFAPRDITPEATLAVVHRNAPGLVEAMRYESLKITPHAMLSRNVAGIRNRTLIINLPGSPKAAIENFEVVIPVIPHAIELLCESPQAEQKHRMPLKSN